MITVCLLRASVYQYRMTSFGAIVHLAGSFSFAMDHGSISLATIEGCHEGRLWKGKSRKEQDM